uniref:Zinc finger, CCHC-type n=1 Tax=Tanacetum cinerariifolium TaxID=118510 RepID=A0A699H461_TANCI|nr:zinc finger, CCHC-type [Tanacetum cinerariifolium]
MKCQEWLSSIMYGEVICIRSPEAALVVYVHISCIHNPEKDSSIGFELELEASSGWTTYARHVETFILYLLETTWKDSSGTRRLVRKELEVSVGHQDEKILGKGLCYDFGTYSGQRSQCVEYPKYFDRKESYQESHESMRTKLDENSHTFLRGHRQEYKRAEFHDEIPFTRGDYDDHQKYKLTTVFGLLKGSRRTKAQRAYGALRRGVDQGKSRSEYIDEFHTLVARRRALTLNSRELQKMTEEKGDGGKGLYVRGRSGQRDMEQGKGTCKVQVQMMDESSFVLDNVMYVLELRRNLISLGTLEKEGFTVKMQSAKIKVKCIFLGYREGIVGNKLWRLDDITSKVVLYRNMGFNESRQYKKTSIGFVVGAGSQKVQTQDLIHYPLARDREQHSARKLFRYREDNNEAAFAVAVAKKIYAHKSLNFNDKVICEVIFKWKTGLKEEIDARSDVYVLSNDGMVFSCGCKAEIWVTKGLLDKAKINILGMEIVRDQSGNTLRVS